MEMKEKKADLEQLLNSLIEKGFRPFGRTNKILHIGRTPDNYIYFDGGFGAEMCYSLRDLTSKESGLWQFVCENMLINKKWFYGDEYCIAEHCEYTPKYYKFRLIVSSLKDEGELEDFLLQNIKIEGK